MRGGATARNTREAAKEWIKTRLVKRKRETRAPGVNQEVYAPISFFSSDMFAVDDGF